MQDHPDIHISDEQRPAIDEQISSSTSLIEGDGFLRLKQIIGDKKAEPPIPPLFPVSASTWWDGVAKKKYPQPVKLSPRTTAWRVRDIRQLINELGQSPETGGLSDATS